MKKSLTILSTIVLLFAACKVTKYNPEKLPARQVIFGDGGGFAGIETSYTLLENGQLFKQVGVNGNLQELKSIKPKQAKALFEKVNSLHLFKLDIEKPGNMYYFLRHVTDNLDSRVTWGAGDYLPPQGLVNVYKELKALTKDRPLAGTKATNGQPSEGKKPEADPNKSIEENKGW